METKGRGISLDKRKKISATYDRYSKPLEKRFASELTKIFKQQAKKIENAYRRYVRENKQDGITKEEADKIVDGLIEQLADWEDVAGEMFLSLLPTYILAGEAGTNMFNSIYRAKDDKILFSVIREDYLDFLNKQGADQIVKVTNSTKRAVRLAIRDGLVNGDSTNKIANSIRETVEEAYAGRAMSIAETEIHNTIMDANVLTAKEAGFKYKRWITSRDQVVRGNKKTDKANHVVLDNEKVKIGSKFSNGLDYPGDVSGPAREVVRCRCILSYE